MASPAKDDQLKEDQLKHYAVYHLDAFHVDVALLNHGCQDCRAARVAAQHYLDGRTLVDVAADQRKLARELEAYGSDEWHPRLFLFARTKDYAQEGVVLVDMDWDGKGHMTLLEVPDRGATGRLMDIELGICSWEQLTN